jgi:hypothetical protein
MFYQLVFGREFFAALEREDLEITARVAAGGCPVCGGRLDRGDYGRKPRGALLAHAGEAQVTRFSLCCAREGCRKRATPPSLRFLGRRVYLGAVVIMAASMARVMGARRGQGEVGVPAMTTGRWLGWWSGTFITTEVFVAVCARLVGVAVDALPTSILERLPGSPTEQVHTMLALLAPLTTGSVPDGARFLRSIV